MLYFENAKKCFASARGLIYERNAESEFYHRFALMIPDKVDVDTLVLAFKIALQDEVKNGGNVLSYISLIPQYVRKCTSYEFSHEFRKKYNEEVLGIIVKELSDVDYGFIEVEKDIIDISNKDRNEVLAALYNASTPVGMGFAQYNPMPWTKEMASMYFDRFGEPDSDGVIRFSWILGRPVNCTFLDNYVYVSEYNDDNEEGLAQKVISTCPNIEKTKRL